MPYQDSYIAKIREKVGHDFELVTATTDTVIENQKGELLMVFNRDFNAWAFPGGYVEPEMSWQENAARESLEEGGIVADPQQLQLIGTVSGRHYVAHYPNGDRTKLYTTIYLLTAWDDELSQIDDTEIDTKRWMSPKTVAHTPLTFSGDAVFRVYQQYKATGQAQALTVDSILQRFLDAQNGEIIGVNSYQDALQELTNGQKQTHWMWFVLPQLKDLGSSARAMYYGIDGEQEANDYLADDTLRERLETIVTTTLNLPDSDPVALFGEVDAQKFQASLTLFGKVADNSELYQRALVKYFNGRLHEPTLALLK